MPKQTTTPLKSSALKHTNGVTEDDTGVATSMSKRVSSHATPVLKSGRRIAHPTDSNLIDESNFSPRQSPATGANNHRRGGSGLTLLQSINSNNTNYMVSGQPPHPEMGFPGAEAEKPDLLSEQENNNADEDLAAQPVQTESSESSNFGEDEENEEAGSSIVPVITDQQQAATVMLIRPDSEDAARESIDDGQPIAPGTPEEKAATDSPKKRMELGGILVYDSYAVINGSQKLQQYYEQNGLQKVDPYVIFTKEQVQAATEQFFGKEARERDFANELDKLYYQRFPKYDMKNKHLKAPQYQISVPPLHNMLIFDSRFESGNLRKAVKVNNIEYNLWLENDLNTKGHTQWFYYKVVFQSDKPAKIQFNIQNLGKTFSLFKVGMKPVVFSLKKYQQKHPDKIQDGQDPLQFKDGWQRGCENIKYFQNEIVRTKIENAKFAANMHNDRFLQNNNGCGEGTENYYTLSFDYRFEYCEDTVWFAHAIPYTYTEMQQNVKEHLVNPQTKSFLKADILCNTLCGMPVPVLTITDNVKSLMPYAEQLAMQTEVPSLCRKAYKQKYNQCRKILKQIEECQRTKTQKALEQTLDEEIKEFCDQNLVTMQATKCFGTDFGGRLQQHVRDHADKRCVVLTSRVHPGEPQASHMLCGTLQMLLADTPLAVELRRNFVFKVVPMLNPDGVIYGNYRCSLLGCDLNRKWLTPNKFLHPTIYYAKQLIRFTHWERRVILYCDMHGHSRKRNVFFYGCSYKNYEQEGRIKNAQLRILPLLCCHKSGNYSFSGSSFRIEKQKESTGRVVVFREFNIMNSFTLECSFHGKQTGPDGKHTQQLTIEDMHETGSALVQQLEYYMPQNIYKLNIIGTKVLDIFYDEFIKFVPSYKLKREKEEMLQQKEEQQQAAQQNPQPSSLVKQQASSNQVNGVNKLCEASQPNKNVLEAVRKPPAVITIKKSGKINLPIQQPDRRDSERVKKQSGNRARPARDANESPVEDGQPADFDINVTYGQRPQAIPDFFDLESFITQTYKKGKDHDEAARDDSSSDDEVIGKKIFMSKNKDKLPNIKNKNGKSGKSKMGSSRQKGYQAAHLTANSDSQQPQGVQQQGQKIHQSAPQQNVRQKEHTINIIRSDIQAPHVNSSANQQLSSAKAGPRIHPQIKNSYNEEIQNFKASNGQNSIVEYVVDGKRIRVQRDKKHFKSPDSSSQLPPQSEHSPSAQNYKTQGGSKNNKLSGHGILKRLPATEKHSSSKPHVNDYRGVKSFTEYAERISYQKQLLIGKDSQAQSNYFDMQASPFKTQHNHPHHSSEKKPHHPLLSSQDHHQTPSLAMTQPEIEHGEVAAKQRRSNLTQYPPQTDQLIKNKALQIMTNTQQNPNVQFHQMICPGLDVLTSHIKSGGGSVLNEQLIEAHRKLIQQDRESIMGIGFSIKMRPQAKHDLHNNPVLSVKSTQSQKKREVINPNLTRQDFGNSMPHVTSQQSANSKLASSRSQENQQNIVQQQVEEQMRAQQAMATQKMGSPMMIEQMQIGANGKPLTSIVCPIKTKMQSSALRTHLKHKRNVQVPLPLHQQERLMAQEQNQLQPASQATTTPTLQDYNNTPTPVQQEPPQHQQVKKMFTQHEVFSPRNKRARVTGESKNSGQGEGILYVPKDKMNSKMPAYQLAHPGGPHLSAIESAELASLNEAQQHNDNRNGSMAFHSRH